MNQPSRYNHLYGVLVHGRAAGDVVEVLLVEKLLPIDASHEETTEHLEIAVQPTVCVAWHLLYRGAGFHFGFCLKYRV